jgi:HEAT repeats
MTRRSCPASLQYGTLDMASEVSLSIMRRTLGYSVCLAPRKTLTAMRRWSGVQTSFMLAQDRVLRYGGMFALGMAYRGTDSNAAIKQLLHFAVSDVDDDVRRAAVLSLGFVLLGVPEQCPAIVRLLAESYNPHLRYGAALAVGVACAGTGARACRV